MAMVVALAIIIGLVGFSLTRNGPSQPVRVAVGSVAPDFTLPTLDGKMVRLHEKRGSVVFINTWASWCPPCVEEMPSIQKLYKALAGEKFEVLAVSIDEDGAKAVAPFMKKHGLTFPALTDPTASIKKTYGLTGVPESFIIDKNGVIVMKFKGPTDWAAPDVLQVFRDLIQRPMKESG
ncbi:MAG: TlpA family protein disulfide reductase [Desulfobacterales bacterium]|nr:TlpA family protein disulfide reductase [Desulfobacterales bacterium]